MLDIKVNTGHFRLLREIDIFRSNEGRPGIAGIIAGINQPGRQTIAVLRAAQHTVLHIPVAIDTVIPFRRIFMLLASSQKAGALFDNCLQILGHKKFKRHGARSNKMIGQAISYRVGGVSSLVVFGAGNGGNIAGSSGGNTASWRI